MDSRLPLAFWSRLVFGLFLIVMLIVFAEQGRWIEAGLSGGVAFLALFNATFLLVAVKRHLLKDD